MNCGALNLIIPNYLGIIIVMNNKSTYICIFIVVIIIVSTVVYFNNQKEGNTIPPKTEITTTQTSTTTSTDFSEAEVLAFSDNKLDTSDWQTYRNEEFGFEVRYPKDWGAVWKDGAFSTADTGNEVGELSILPKDVVFDDPRIIRISVYLKTLVEYAEELSPRGWYIKENISINNAYGVVFSTKKANGEWEGYDGAPVVSRENFVYSFYGGVTPVSTIFQKVLLSFKFIE